MTPSLNARFVAKVLGVPAVMAVGIVGYVWLATAIAPSAIPDWLKVFILVVYIPIPFAVAWRLWKGGEQGPIDVVVTETADSRTIVLGNVPLTSSARELARAMRIFKQLSPVPRPVGRLQGNPADPASAVRDERAALPEQIQVTDKPLPVPEEAKGLSIEVQDEILPTGGVDVKPSG